MTTNSNSHSGWVTAANPTPSYSIRNNRETSATSIFYESKLRIISKDLFCDQLFEIGMRGGGCLGGTIYVFMYGSEDTGILCAHHSLIIKYNSDIPSRLVQTIRRKN